MKIISENISDWSREVMCKSCNALLEINSDDINRGYDYGEYFITCPVCLSKCTVEKLPKPIMIKITNKHGMEKENLLEPPREPRAANFDRARSYDYYDRFK